MYITINNRRIGPGYPVYIIAEMSANHHQDFDKAVRILEQAKQAGADAVKLQTYTPDTMTLACDNEYFRIGKGTVWEGKNLYELYREAYTPWEWQPKLKRIAGELGLDLFSSPFDATAVDFLEGMDVPAYKIASFEVVDLPLIAYIARTGKPIILSTGMAALGEIEEAVSVIHAAGNHQVALLKCTSAYPAPPEEMNLRTLQHMSEAFDVPTGLSDHTMGSTSAVVAVSLGACIIEKHFTLSRSVSGPDSTFSMEPVEFREMVSAIRTAEKAIGDVSYRISGKQMQSRIFRRSLFVASDIPAGERFSESNIRCIRPANGLHPRYLKDIIGRRSAADVKAGTPLSWEMVG